MSEPRQDTVASLVADALTFIFFVALLVWGAVAFFSWHDDVQKRLNHLERQVETLQEQVKR